MNIEVIRLQDDGQSTIGTMSIDGEFECFTLEDTHNEPKIYGKTCIPAGTYEIKLRNEGGMTQKYAARYGNTHKGMIWLQDVPNFKWVYIHIGNDETDTDGCILVGQTCDKDKGTVGRSRLAYQALNEKILSAMDRGEDIFITVI